MVLSGPSGVGKDTVLQALKKRNLPLHFVVTATDRPPRPGEVDGVDYIFVSREEFERMIAADEMLEYAVVYGDYKGVPKAQIRQALASGKDVILRVDVQGAARLRALCPEAVLIFLAPANVREWYQRLINRHSETPETLQRRIEAVRRELTYLDMFDYVVVNRQDHLEQAVDQIVAIIQVEHLRVHPRRITL
ncbi:MAG: guanylate kinase [Thermanaerothrix sp.]|nr:guanylate kinase [Thermanaerothrix sp.]